MTYIDCREEWGEFEGKTYTGIIFLLTFMLPLIILAYTYGAIGLKLFNYKAPNNSQPLQSQANNKFKVSFTQFFKLLFKMDIFDHSRKQLWAKGAKAPSETSEKLSVDLLALGLSKIFASISLNLMHSSKNLR
jgi:hypothetical protein